MHTYGHMDTWTHMGTWTHGHIWAHGHMDTYGHLPLILILYANAHIHSATSLALWIIKRVDTRKFYIPRKSTLSQSVRQSVSQSANMQHGCLGTKWINITSLLVNFGHLIWLYVSGHWYGCISGQTLVYLSGYQDTGIRTLGIMVVYQD